MKSNAHSEMIPRLRASRGFTLVELMVALLIGIFLTAGILTLVGAMKRTTTAQTGLSQLQDNERIAMSLITDLIQTAGYYPNPVVNGPTTFFLVTTTAPVFAAGQSITGYPASTVGDTISLRYATSGTDNVIDCTGNTSTTQTSYTNTLSLDANGNLQCVLTNGAVTTTVQLVSGLSNMQILYGVRSNPSSTSNSVDAYLTATQVTAGNYWSNVLSVKVTLTFPNPLAGAPGQTSIGATIPFTRVITVMNKTGVDS